MHCVIFPESNHLMFHYSGLVVTNYYRCTVDYQCMAYAQAHLQAILLPKSTFSSDLHCSTEIKQIIHYLILLSNLAVFYKNLWFVCSQCHHPFQFKKKFLKFKQVEKDLTSYYLPSRGVQDLIFFFIWGKTQETVD